MGKQTVIRYHDFCAGHTVTGHESKCRHLHGHNYRVTFHVQSLANVLDEVGRVVDFSVVKEILCEWLENNWDHKFLIFKEDPRLDSLFATDPNSLIVCAFNPTAENMAKHLVEVIAPALLEDTGLEVNGVVLEETRKCSISYFKD